MAVRKFADAAGITELWSKVKSYISGVLPTKTSDLTNDSGYITGMEILSYGISTWDDFTDAYNAKKVVYCRASSNSNPASGSQTRLAFMAYVNNAATPTEVEFQYYRSINTHTESQQGDQVFVYKLTSANKWTVITREAASKVAAGGDLTRSYSNGTVTISGTIPTVPTNVSAFTNDAGYITGYTETDPTVPAWAKASSKPSYTASEVGAQPTLVSGTNIKTINNNSILGSGNLSISVDVDTEMSGSSTNAVQNRVIKSYVDNAVAGVATFSQINVTLASDGWSNNTQTVNAPGVTSTNAILVSSLPSNMAEYLTSEIQCISQGSNSLTFGCQTTPGENIGVNILILGTVPVSYSETPNSAGGVTLEINTQ